MARKFVVLIFLFATSLFLSGCNTSQVAEVLTTPPVPTSTVSIKSSPSPLPTVKASQPPSDCHPSYMGACLDPNASDYDCIGGSGNGPKYTGTVYVIGPDVFDLDRDGDGVGCEK